MKKIAILLIVAILAVSLLGCQSTNKEEKPETTEAESTIEETEDTTEETEEEIVTVTGAWTVNDSIEANISEESAQTFSKALQGFAGVGYTPLLLLGSQVVNGANYAFLCRSVVISQNPTYNLNVVKVYQNSDGTASIEGAKVISISDLSEVEVPESTEESSEETLEADAAAVGEAEATPETETVEIATGGQLAGGWSVNSDLTEGTLPELLGKAFESVTEGLVGVKYTPLALLGTQVVAGANYAILCTSTKVVENPTTELCVVFIYVNAVGEPSLSKVVPLNIVDFVQ